MKQITEQHESLEARLPRVYQSPKIIYEGTISTRAGSPTDPIVPSDDRVVDPVDLFSDEAN